ncbi:hypothetical protein [Pseudolysinimonas sp.]|uniref:hypothetical protein n=1 Tax=Pseudolysinimonas sp. TaxID=2680009 RepID=UPI00286A7670|nr:hypothetical protein [Pseudolysinimonas sp.]
MRTTNKKRLLAAGIVTAILLGGAGTAYAYWTNTGSGVGEADTGTNSSITVVQTSVVTNIRPGSGTHALSGNFNNPNSGSVFVASVSVSIGTIVDALGDPIVGCEADDYVIAGSPVTVNANVPAGNGQGSWSGATIAFVNEAAENQDGCKNATVNLVYTSN